MSSSTRVMVVLSSNPPGPGLAALMEREDICVSAYYSLQDVLQRLPEINPHVVVIECRNDSTPTDADALNNFLEEIDSQGIACLLLAGEEYIRSQQIPEWVQTLDHYASSDELWGHLASIRHYQMMTRRVELEMRHMQRLGRHIDKQFTELDQDMRLARRLQQEFLPADLPVEPGIKFSVLYRPAAWVSGDIYDIARVDEHHISFYVADAVGHGMAASLLTMFVKQAIHSKELADDSYHVLSPSKTLQRFNDALAAERLDHSQFVTASYCLLNHKDMTLSFARGGHPYPILVERNGSISELKSEGGLLGLFPGQEFPTRQIKLLPGQKLIVHSDGMDHALVEDRDYQTGQPRYKREFQRMAHLSAEEMTRRMEEMIDEEEGSLNPRDDVTIIVLEITG